jgi:hypothetical protein
MHKFKEHLRKGEFDFKCRGIGRDHIDKCFCCHKKPDHYAPHNISGFVKSKEDGERIVEEVFDGYARLDYRDFEPNWIQVKVGTCDDCHPALEELERLTRGNTIYKRDVFIAKQVVMWMQGLTE